MLSTLFEGSYAFSDFSIDSLNNLRNYSKDELYIQLIYATSMMVK